MRKREDIIKMDKNNLKEKEAFTCEKDALERLDTFLMNSYPDRSRSYFQKLIKSDLVLVNGKPASKSLILKSGDRVEITFSEPPSVRGVPQDVPFEIIDTKKEFLIVNKPAGLVVHYTTGRHAGPTLVNGLLYRFREFSEFGDQDRPGIVHRLDKDTSGLLIVARNSRSQAELSGLFKDRKVKKEYLAVVKGHPDLEGEIDLPIGRHPTERTKMSHVSYSGRSALTHYRVLKYFKKGINHPECALVSVRIITGRTHQIRVHFAALGHGLIGDSLYGIQSKLIGRQALHAYKIAFEFQGEMREYAAPIPEDLLALLTVLEKAFLENYS